MTTRSQLRNFNKPGTVVPIFERVAADLHTPVSAYLRTARKKGETFLLESVEGGEKLARYSFLGATPLYSLRGSVNGIEIRRGKKGSFLSGDPLRLLSELLSRYTPVRAEQLPRFTGGGVGYFTYEAVSLVERVPIKVSNSADLPLFQFSLYHRIIAFDHLKQEMVIIANLISEESLPPFTEQYDDAINWIEDTSDALRATPKLRSQPIVRKAVKPKAHLERDRFLAMVRRAKEYIREGDIFQVVLSQRWHMDSDRDALTVYRRLRRLNPSPYMFLLTEGDDAVVGASPEMLVRVEQGDVETRPIAGTRPRGKTETEDAAHTDALLADRKELAEHTMLLDLGRNDLGRVCRPGSVHVHEPMHIEKYSHVMHIVSSVRGKLEAGRSPLDAHFACFPAGTVSGAPKIRAMEIIHELEKEKRGVYAGTVGYMDFWGNFDSCIAIRTLVKRGRRYFLQAGAGIVADSVPETEFEETVAKARILVEAVGGKE